MDIWNNSPTVFGQFVFPTRNETSRQSIGHEDGFGPLMLVVEEPIEAVDLSAVELLFLCRTLVPIVQFQTVLDQYFKVFSVALGQRVPKGPEDKYFGLNT